jgi:hypothetical protein
MTDKQKIKDLEKQLEFAKKHTYVYDTTSLQCSEGEFYMYYGDDRCVVFDVETLFKDLPFMITQVVKEQAKMQDCHLENLKESLMELMIENKESNE